MSESLQKHNYGWYYVNIGLCDWGLHENQNYRGNDIGRITPVFV
jgi:hypothetical protein